MPASNARWSEIGVPAAEVSAERREFGSGETVAGTAAALGPQKSAAARADLPSARRSVGTRIPAVRPGPPQRVGTRLAHTMALRDPLKEGPTVMSKVALFGLGRIEQPDPRPSPAQRRGDR